MRIEADLSSVVRLAKKLGDTAMFEKEFGGVWKDANQTLFVHCFQEAPVDQGQLRKSMAVIFPTNLSSEIGTDDSKCPYAKFVYGGTRPHLIKARFAKALAFIPKGSLDSIVRFSVKHRGSKPNPYLLNSFNRHDKEFTAELEKGAVEILETL